MGLREANKAKRRDRILAAGRVLLQSRGAAGLTMRALAREAGVAEVTPYNLFGSKAGVVEALWERAMFDLVLRNVAATPSDPLDQLFVGVEVLAASWSEAGDDFRELQKAARESGADLRRFSEGPIAILRAGLGQAAEAGYLSARIPLDDVARHIFLANQGAYESWSTGGVDADQLRRDMVAGLAIALLSVATPRGVSAVRKRLRRAERGRA